MNREKRLSVRFAATGGGAVKAEMRDIGVTGNAAMDRIAAGAAPAEAGLDNMSNAAVKARMLVEQLAAQSAASAAAMRRTAQAGSAVQAQINRATGVTSPTGMSAAETLRQGQALDDLRAKFNPVFGVIRQYRNEVAEMRAAHMQGAISADEMAAAISRSRTAALNSIAAYKNQSRAISQMSRAARGGTQRMQQMFFQVNDIGVSLAGGMNPFIVLAQQGTQIAQIYGFGNGGVSGIFRDLGKMIRGVVGRFPLLTAAIIGSAAAIGGLSHEINEVSNVTVTFGDTALAVWQVISQGIWDWIKPAVDKIAPWFAAAWDLVVTGVKNVGNFIINSFTFVTRGIGVAIDAVPAMFEKAFKAALAQVQWAIGRMAHTVHDMLSSVARGFNSVFGTDLSGPGGLQGFGTDMLNAGTVNSAAARALSDRADVLGRVAAARREIMSRDPMGDFFEAVSGRAQDNARNRLAEDDDGKGGGGAVKRAKQQKNAVDDLIKSLQQELAVLRETDPIKKKMLKYAEQLTGATAAQRQQVLNQVIALDKAKHGWEAAGRALKKYAEDSKRLGDDLGNTLTGAFGKVEDAISRLVAGGKANFKDLVRSIIAELSKLATRRFITGPLSGLLGQAFNAVIGAFDPLAGALRGAGLPAIPSMDGGGWTGNGPRSGGLDNKGGFLAMLHPQEYVHDTRKSGRGGFGGELRIVIEESASFASTVRTEADGIAVDRVRQGLDLFKRQVLPNEVNKTLARPRDIG